MSLGVGLITRRSLVQIQPPLLHGITAESTGSWGVALPDVFAGCRLFAIAFVGNQGLDRVASITRRQVRVPQGHLDIGVAKQFLHCLELHAPLHQLGRERVPQIVDPNLRQPGLLQCDRKGPLHVRRVE